MHDACIWCMNTMQSAADSCFLAYDNQVLAFVYYHYNLSCSKYSPSQFTGINVQLIYDQIRMVE